MQQIVPLPFREFKFQAFTGKRRIVSFGWRYDFNGGGLTEAVDMPEFLLAIRAQAEAFAAIPEGALQQVLSPNRRLGQQSAGIRTARSSVTLSGFLFSPPASSVCAAKPAIGGSGAI